MPVSRFKGEISSTIGIPADQQRLIFRGRVLQDDKKISDYGGLFIMKGMMMMMMIF
jgi:hypothetical protein